MYVTTTSASPLMTPPPSLSPHSLPVDLQKMHSERSAGEALILFSHITFWLLEVHKSHSSWGLTFSKIPILTHLVGHLPNGSQKKCC